MMELFLVSAALILAIWVGYPLVIHVRATARPKPTPGQPPFPSLGALIVTRDPPEVVQRRVDNLLASRGCAFEEILVVLDWNARNGLEAMKEALQEKATVILGGEAGGKAAGLNAGMAGLPTDWVLLADSWQAFRPDAVRRLMEGMAGDTYAAVSGRVAHEHDDPVMAMFWRFENGVRSAQSTLHSIVTTSGAICLLRRAHWQALPEGAICDDLFLTLGLVKAGQRVGYVPDALAIDPRNPTRSQLFRKKVRTLTGLWQLMRWRPHVLSPRQNPIFFHFLFHKLGRLATPYLVILAAAGLLPSVLPALGRIGLTVWLLVLATVALVAILRPRLVRTAWSTTVWALSLLVSPVMATFNGLRGDWMVWDNHAAGESK